MIFGFGFEVVDFCFDVGLCFECCLLFFCVVFGIVYCDLLEVVQVWVDEIVVLVMYDGDFLQYWVGGYGLVFRWLVVDVMYEFGWCFFDFVFGVIE